ncbi:MAG: hypothetical protein V1872_11425 [bacterium]
MMSQKNYKTKLNEKSNYSTLSCIFNRVKALTIVKGNSDLFKKTMNLFLEDAPKQIFLLEDAFNSKNQKFSEHIAFSLKLAAYNIGAEQLSNRAMNIELSIRDENISKAKRILKKLKKDFELLKERVEDENPGC